MGSADRVTPAGLKVCDNADSDNRLAATNSASQKDIRRTRATFAAVITNVLSESGIRRWNLALRAAARCCEEQSE